MRSDYLLFALAAVFFIMTAASLILVIDQTEKSLWVVGTVVVGLFSASLGLYFRPKAQMTTGPVAEAPAPEPGAVSPANVETPDSITATQVAIVPATTHALAPIPTVTTIPVEASSAAESQLTKVIGINSKRAAQLNALGINSLNDLAQASAEDLAKGLMISPKITRMWIGSAKKLK